MNNVLRKDVLPLLGFLAVLGFIYFDPLGLFGMNALAQDAAGTVPNPGQQSTPATPTPTLATPVGDSFPAIANILGMIFILAVLIEVGLAVLYKWRIFLRYFEGKGLKVPINFLVSYSVVLLHGIDVPADVVKAFDFQPGIGSLPGQLISALIIAGGSASVNGVFQKLGWRNPAEQKQEAKEEREKSVGTFWIKVERISGGTADGKPVTLRIDNKLLQELPPDAELAGGAEGFQMAPGKKTISASWTSAAGEDKQETLGVHLAAKTKTSETLTLT